MRIRTQLPLLLYVMFLGLIACEPLAPAAPTPQVIVVSPPPTDTPLPTPTAVFTRTPVPTEMPEPPTATPPICASNTGQVINVSEFISEIAGGENLRFRAYLPPCYIESQKRFPYVILLHGANSIETQWDEISADEVVDQGVRLGVLPPMILIMPFTGNIGNRNTFPPDPSYEDVVLKELVPEIERDFCTWSDRDHRAIGGISRGGFWAYSIALRHPDVFGIVGGHSAAFDTDNAPPANNPLDLALNASFLEDANLRMYLDNASSDPAGVELELFSSRLSARNIPHTYVINPVGDHSDAYWASHMQEYVSFYGRDWPRSLADLPSCLEPSPQ